MRRNRLLVLAATTSVLLLTGTLTGPTPAATAQVADDCGMGTVDVHLYGQSFDNDQAANTTEYRDTGDWCVATTTRTVPVASGSAIWFAEAAPDGDVVFGTMPLTNNQTVNTATAFQLLDFNLNIETFSNLTLQPNDGGATVVGGSLILGTDVSDVCRSGDGMLGLVAHHTAGEWDGDNPRFPAVFEISPDGAGPPQVERWSMEDLYGADTVEEADFPFRMDAGATPNECDAFPNSGANAAGWVAVAFYTSRTPNFPWTIHQNGAVAVLNGERSAVATYRPTEATGLDAELSVRGIDLHENDLVRLLAREIDVGPTNGTETLLSVSYDSNIGDAEADGGAVHPIQILRFDSETLSLTPVTRPFFVQEGGGRDVYADTGRMAWSGSTLYLTQANPKTGKLAAQGPVATIEGSPFFDADEASDVCCDVLEPDGHVDLGAPFGNGFTMDVYRRDDGREFLVLGGTGTQLRVAPIDLTTGPHCAAPDPLRAWYYAGNKAFFDHRTIESGTFQDDGLLTTTRQPALVGDSYVVPIERHLKKSTWQGANLEHIAATSLDQHVAVVDLARVTADITEVTDVPSSSVFADDIQTVIDRGILTCDAAHAFSPTAPVNRGPMAAVLHRLAGDPATTIPTPATFADVPNGVDDGREAHPFVEDIEWASAQGIVTGYSDGTFRPDQPVTRQTMAAFLYRLAGTPEVELPATPTFSDVTGGIFQKSIEWLAASGIAQGDGGEFHPLDPVNRQQLAAFAASYLEWAQT